VVLFFIVNLFAPLITGFIVPILLDRWAAPHQESLKLKVLISMGCALLLVTLVHIVKENSLPLQYAMPIGLACSLAGTCCSEVLGFLRFRMAKTGTGTGKAIRTSRSKASLHGSERAPQGIFKKNPRSPISDKHSTPDDSAEG